MPTFETRRLNPVLLWVIFLAVLLFAILVARAFSNNQVEIRAASVDRQNLQSTVPTNGRVEPIEGYSYAAYAPGPGIVSKIFVQVPQQVKAGDLLIKMDDSDAVARLASANSTLETAQATLHDLIQGGTQDERIALAGDLSRARLQQQQATSDVAALKQLQQKGAASPSEVAAAEQRLQATDNSIKNIQMRSTERYSSSDRAAPKPRLPTPRPPSPPHKASTPRPTFARRSPAPSTPSPSPSTTTSRPAKVCSTSPT